VTGRDDPSKAPSELTVKDACELLGVNKATVKRRIDRGVYRARLTSANGGQQYRIEVASLPQEDRLRYLARQIKAQSPAGRLVAVHSLEAIDEDKRAIAREARVTLRKHPTAPQALTNEASEQAHAAFERLPSSLQEEAHRRARAMVALASLDPSLPLMERYRLAAQDTGVSEGSLRRWRRSTKNLARADWPAALVPAWGASAPPKAELTEDAWQYILNEWACQSKPALAPIYRRAKKLACEHGWMLPSKKTIQRRINEIPAPQRAYLREGEKGLDRYYPSLRRNYATLHLHQMWCSDGRKADLFCEWPDGYVGRPIVVAWQELRSRKILGWTIGKTETAELARLAFHKAARTAGAVPESVYLDNGRAYAAKEMTGGQATRNRFKINEADPLGILTLFSIETVWATPYRGQVKPIESFWNTIAQAERCKAFAGSWCGNSSGEKPDEFNRRTVPIDVYAAFVQETIDAKNAEAHRGSAMGAKSPNDVYAELMQSTAPRVPTDRQLRLCLMAVENVRLDKTHAVSVLGNRYWDASLTQLDRSKTYQARYNSTDMSEPIALYDGHQLIAEVPLWQEGEFRSRSAAKEHTRASNRFKKAQRDEAQARQDMTRARRSWEPDEAVVPSAIVSDGVRAVAPKVMRPVRVPIELRVDRSKLQSRDQAERDATEFEDALYRAHSRQKGQGLRRANGGD
jgi:hypothetical protein